MGGLQVEQPDDVLKRRRSGEIPEAPPIAVRRLAMAIPKGSRCLIRVAADTAALPVDGRPPCEGARARVSSV